MNEQLIVKNFGPIKDATVDFKRVTVFIGPTGGGKSTLAKLLSAFKSSDLYPEQTKAESRIVFKDYSINNYFKKSSFLSFTDKNKNIDTIDGNLETNHTTNQHTLDFIKEMRDKRDSQAREKKTIEDTIKSLRQIDEKSLKSIASKIWAAMVRPSIYYIPAERVFVSALEYSWAGLIRDDIGLSRQVLNFANNFSLSRQEINELFIEFLQIKYIHRNGQDFIKTHNSKKLFRLYETASGIQSVTPLLVLLEHLSRNTEQAQSFIIEEPELNLYPTAQQGLLNWLVEKCTQGENDLTITTHSPYILSHLNLLLYAHYVGNKDEEKRQKIAAIIPEKYWLNPDEFSAYYVGDGGVRSLLDPETKLISQNGLDTVSGVQADEFDQLLDINNGF